jgi:hypothetical protein
VTADGGLKHWIKARILPLLPEDWLGRSGQKFRSAVEAIRDFTELHVHPKDKLDQAPDVLWKTAQIKSSQAELNLAQAEERKVNAELARRTLHAKTRQEEAAARKEEALADQESVKAIEARLRLYETLKAQNVTVSFDLEGNATFAPAPADYPWDLLRTSLCPPQPDQGAPSSKDDAESPKSFPTSFVITQTK